MYSTLVVFSSVTVLALAAKGLLCWAHGGPARGRQKLEIEKRRRLLHGQRPSACSSGRRSAGFDRWRSPAGPPNSGFRANTPRNSALLPQRTRPYPPYGGGPGDVTCFLRNTCSALSLTPIHSLRHRLVRSRQYAEGVALGFLRF